MKLSKKIIKFDEINRSSVLIEKASSQRVSPIGK
jgi:hypothetical protein